MATTIDQQPTINRATSVNGPIIFRLSATSTAGPKFRYVCRVKDGAGVEIVTLKAPPNAADEAVFDISLILRDYVKAALLNRLQTSAPVYTGAAANFPYTGYNPAAFFKVDLGSSEAADAASAPVTTYDHTDQKVNALIFPGDSGDEDWLGSIYNKGVAVADYRPSTGGAGWLSDIPTSSYSGILGGTSIEQYCTARDYRVCNFMYAANSTSGRDLGNEATVLKLSYYNTNTAANVNESYTLATELTVASTAITADRQMIAMAISGPKNWKTFGGLGIGAAISAGYVNTYEMRLEDGGGAAKSYTLVTHIVDVDCYNGNPMSLGWQNQAGGWDFFNFTQKRVKSTKSKRESFYKDAGTWQSSTTFKPWSDVEGGATTYIAENQRSIQLNTGWITDAESNLLESLFVSEAVFLLNPDNPDYATNVKLTNMSYTQKLNKNDGLFKYTITIEYGKTRKNR
tara:strand:- start:449 stop:1819 length:1371 start_codon:yes stop_codon:yes gene_type:complete